MKGYYLDRNLVKLKQVCQKKFLSAWNIQVQDSQKVAHRVVLLVK